MHTQAAPALGDADEGVEEAGVLHGKCRELVDHHDQARQHRRAAGEPRGGEVGGAVLAHGSLTKGQFGTQAAQRPIGERAVEIGDRADHMW
ncbi:MAG: hypothetical protein FD127_1627 [Acidimicrobiaceae bacterium]|nr:MAG: hypothetical protein FD127_1627 [Acidimicrobiaceae bacterium]